MDGAMSDELPAQTVPSAAPVTEASSSTWRPLSRAGGYAALITLAVALIGAGIFANYPPPSTTAGFFLLFQRNALLGLLEMDLLWVADSALIGLLFLALYVAVRRAHPSFSAIALTSQLVAVATHVASNTAFEMLSLSNQHAAATTDEERSALLAAGHALRAISFEGTAFNVHYILSALGLILMSVAMSRSHLFPRTAAGWGLLAGALMLVPPTVGAVGLALGLASFLPLGLWLILVARTLLRLGRSPLENADDASKTTAIAGAV
jgi:hypothetical protein